MRGPKARVLAESHARVRWLSAKGFWHCKPCKLVSMKEDLSCEGRKGSDCSALSWIRGALSPSHDAISNVKSCPTAPYPNSESCASRQHAASIARCFAAEDFQCFVTHKRKKSQPGRTRRASIPGIPPSSLIGGWPLG
ncbi:hypothetical protein KC347_g14 [Hortaea werneckii]|nr:hypothetical protein KC347_g14 [Hortaea werneckii]